MTMAGPLDEFSGDPLTFVENQKARKIIRDQERVTWLYQAGRWWIAYIAGAIAGFYAVKDQIADFIKWLAR